jgi:hypothetical protein
LDVSVVVVLTGPKHGKRHNTLGVLGSISSFGAKRLNLGPLDILIRKLEACNTRRS